MIGIGPKFKSCLFVILVAVASLSPGCPKVIVSTGQESHTHIDRFDSLSLERTQCFGQCPAYKVTVSGDGRVDFEGREWVETLGHQSATLTKHQLAELAKAFSDADYFSFRDRYVGTEDGCPTTWTDNPTVTTTIEANGKKKSIRHYYGCRERDLDDAAGDVYPRVLTLLEKRIDEVVGTARWVGARPH